MVEERVQRRLAAILAADVVGYTGSYDESLTRRIEQALLWQWANGYMGRQLPHLFRQAELDELVIEPLIHLPPFHPFSRITNSTLEAASKMGRLSESDLTQRWSGIKAAKKADVCV